MKKREQLLPEILAELKNNLSPEITYHNYEHTALVLEELRLLIDATPELNSEDAEILLMAAAGHDLGYLDGPEDHEVRSAQMMQKILSEYQFTEPEKEKIYSLILATKFPSSPQNLSEKLLCDADLSSVGRSDFFLWADKLRREMGNLTGNIFSEREWLEFEYGFVTEIRFESPAGIERYEKTRQLNVAKLWEKIEKLNQGVGYD